jgi:uncharacterized lipoprotein YddW (UPF0748 family)
LVKTKTFNAPLLILIRLKMKNMKTCYPQKLLVVLLMFVVWACHNEPVDPDTDTDPVVVDRPYDKSKDEIIVDKKEIRAAWITTVGNYDWPLTKNNPDAQRNELRNYLQKCKTLNFNAAILQIRPTADAFYPSELEPWSIYLTGIQGLDPGYDPLKYAIDETHKMGMEFHAWLNPYRIGLTSIALSPNHVAVKNPSWMIVYNGNRYFNPGMPEVRTHLKAVISDIITRYDVDAIHFDDYFYPDGVKAATDPFIFDDKTAFAQYGGGKDIHTWRADNISTMVSEVSQLIRSTKPGVLFGISPSGRRENSMALYADPFIWLDNKWIDYLAPQIYWEIGHPTADFANLTTFWNNNARGVPIVIGIAAYKFKDVSYPAYATVSEFNKEIDEVRKKTHLSGCFFYRMKYLENTELFNFMKTKYPYLSVLPAMGTSLAGAVSAPAISSNGLQISWNSISNATKYAVYELELDTKLKNTFNAHAVAIATELTYSGKKGKNYFVTAVNADQLESVRSEVITLN